MLHTLRWPKPVLTGLARTWCAMAQSHRSRRHICCHNCIAVGGVRPHGTPPEGPLKSAQCGSAVLCAEAAATGKAAIIRCLASAAPLRAQIGAAGGRQLVPSAPSSICCKSPALHRNHNDDHKGGFERPTMHFCWQGPATVSVQALSHPPCPTLATRIQCHKQTPMHVC
ncbi:hypothetical protein COO60DRAFT_259447 [Scenedesmus sp. NREL 46B-D3]|nr:hypothetical protein COO60DRAFT_259447 [Scenedesmus sp. NREL 46B-D3]